MDDKLNELNNWAKELKSKLGDYKSFMDETIKDLPKEEKEKVNKAMNGIDMEEMQKMANNTIQGMINDIHSKFKI